MSETSVESVGTVAYAHSETVGSTAVLLGYVGLKLIGVYVLIQCLVMITYFVSNMVMEWSFSSLSNGPFGQFAAMAGIELVVGVLLLVFAGDWSRRLFAPLGGGLGLLTVEQAVALISVAAGLWLVAENVGGAIVGVIGFIEHQRQASGGITGVPARYSSSTTEVISTLAPLLNVVLGVFLFIRPGWIVGKFRLHSKMP